MVTRSAVSNGFASLISRLVTYRPRPDRRRRSNSAIRLDWRRDMLEEAIGFDQIEPVAQVAPRHRRGNARDRFRR